MALAIHQLNAQTREELLVVTVQLGKYEASYVLFHLKLRKTDFQYIKCLNMS